MAGSRTPRLSDEEKTRLGGDDALKAAQKAKPGDPDLSGAAPGIKAKTDESVNPSEVDTFDTPAKARRAERQAEKRVDEVREIQREVQSKNLLENVPPDSVRTVFATQEGSKDPASLTTAIHGGGITVFASQPEMRFNNREDALAVVRHFSQIAAAL